MRAVWHDVTRTVKVKLDFVNVTKSFPDVSKHFGMQKAVALDVTWTVFGHHFQAAASI